jgi:DNA (cytosine-5)-methyltransferase 1
VKVLDLFSGIGGFSLGFESTGYFQTTKFVEMDKYCQKILRKNFPGIKIEEDIRNVKGQEYEADVITGGFPCQPFSVAGRQKGTSDDRYLWPEMFRLIKEIKPKWVVGENVSGLINLQDGMVLRQVQDDLEGEGFEVQCFIIPASGIGAWHQRKRVWIVAYSERNGQLASKKRRGIKETISEKQEGSNHSLNAERTSSISTTEANVANTESFGRREPRDINKEKRNKESISTQSNGCGENVSDPESMRSRGRSSQECGSQEWKLQQIKQEGSSLRNKIKGCSPQDVSNTNSGQCIGENEEIQTGRQTIASGSKGDVSDTESLRTQRLWTFREQEPATYGEEELSLRQSQNSGKSWWEIESNLCGVPDGLSYELDKARAPRIKALGNSIVPQIARQIALSIIYAENN